MPLKKWDTGSNSIVPAVANPTAATRAEVRRGVYCPQNRWGTVTFGIDAMVGFAHVKEGVDGQLAGLGTMLRELAAHKSVDKVNAFACGSTTANRNATRFRSKIQRAVSNAGIRNFASLYSDFTKCPAWLVILKQLDAECVIGTAGITSCIGVVAWSPTTLAFDPKYIDFANLVELENVTLQQTDTGTLDEVDLGADLYKV